MGEAAKKSQSSPTPLEQEVIDLFDALRDSLFRYILSNGLSAHDSEDIIQEVFLALFRHLKLGRSRHNLRGWVFRVAHNLSLKRRFANQKNSQQLPRDGSPLSDSAPNAEEQLVFSEKHALLVSVFKALPELDQNCIRLRAEGLKYREIAEVLGISLAGVSVCLARALARLQRADGR